MGRLTEFFLYFLLFGQIAGIGADFVRLELAVYFLLLKSHK